MPKMTEEFLNEIMKNVVGVLCQNIGWHAAQTTSVDILADLMKRQFLQLAKASHNYAEHYGRTQPNLDDAALALRDAGINASELEEYVQNFDPVLLPYAKDVPMFPVSRESKLNFLRPGSEEVLTRPVHVHEYMPPMIFEEEIKDEKEGETKDKEEEEDIKDSKEQVATDIVEVIREKTPERVVAVVKVETRTNGHTDEGDDSSEDEIEALEKSPGSKGFVPFSSLGKKLSKTKKGPAGENPALKRVRMMLEEEGPPMREITSVMMTTSGFLTSSREGRLPDTRPPPNREFFDPAPPAIEKKKKVLTMKRIVEGVKKIDKEDKEKENDSDRERDEPVLFGNPDRISTAVSSTVKDINIDNHSDKASSKEKDSMRKSKKLKKLKLDKEMMRKLAKGLEERDKKLNKSKTKQFLDKTLKKNKKIKDKLSRKQHHFIKQDTGIDNVDSDEDFSSEQLRADLQSHDEQMIRIPKKKDQMMLDQFKKHKTFLPLPPKLTVAPPKISPKAPSSLSMSADGEILKKPRGRPRKNPILPASGGVPIPPAALAGLGRALMDEKHRPLKIKKSHMQPALRSLIPDISINTKPPRMQQPPPPGFDMLMGLPSAPGLIPTGYLPPPPPLIKMPTPVQPPSIQITPSTPTTPGANIRSGKEGKSQHSFSSLPGTVCSSVTITPIDMPGQKLPTRYDKTVTPGIGSPVLSAKQPKAKEKSPIIAPAVLPMSIKTEPSSGITITPIVMDKGDRFESIQPGDKPIKSDKPQSMLAKLDEDMKSKEQKKKDKERKRELKKEKKKEKKDKSKDKDRGERDKSKGDKKERKEKDKDKKKKKDKSLAEQMSPNSLLGTPTVPKLTLKFGGHSGTPTPVDSPNPPQVYLGEASPPLPKKIIFKPIEEGRKKSPSPEVARFSALVTRPPKPQRTAKTNAAIGIAAEAMGTSLAQQVVSFPPIPSSVSSSGGGGGGSSFNSKRGRGRPNRDSDLIPEKMEKPGKDLKPSKTKGAQGGLITETVGCITDEHGNKIWICPQCGRQDDGSPMIGCDKCDDWYHFTCMGITETPDEDMQWFCPRCRKKTKKDRK